MSNRKNKGSIQMTMLRKYVLYVQEPRRSGDRGFRFEPICDVYAPAEIEFSKYGVLHLKEVGDE